MISISNSSHLGFSLKKPLLYSPLAQHGETIREKFQKVGWGGVGRRLPCLCNYYFGGDTRKGRGWEILDSGIDVSILKSEVYWGLVSSNKNVWMNDKIMTSCYKLPHRLPITEIIGMMVFTFSPVDLNWLLFQLLWDFPPVFSILIIFYPFYFLLTVFLCLLWYSYLLFLGL